LQGICLLLEILNFRRWDCICDARLRSYAALIEHHILTLICGYFQFSFSSSGVRIEKIACPLASQIAHCARWNSFLLHLPHNSHCKSLVRRLMDFNPAYQLFFIFFFFLENSWTIFLELLRFSLFNFQMRKAFSFGVSTFRKLKLALDSLLLRKENTKVGNLHQFASSFTIAFAWIQVDQGLLYLSSSTASLVLWKCESRVGELALSIFLLAVPARTIHFSKPVAIHCYSNRLNQDLDRLPDRKITSAFVSSLFLEYSVHIA